MHTARLSAGLPFASQVSWAGGEESCEPRKRELTTSARAEPQRAAELEASSKLHALARLAKATELELTEVSVLREQSADEAAMAGGGAAAAEARASPEVIGMEDPGGGEEAE